jgi:DNA invertase Pin-like site-specific DNA recombinase
MRCIGYARVSSDEQAKSGAGLAAQHVAISAEVARRDWELIEIVEDAGFSARDLNRPGIRGVLERLADREADALMVGKLDRLSRSVLDFATLMEKSRREGWGLVALDIGVDTTTPSGEVMANVMAAFAEFERRLIGQRTREALEQRRAAGIVLGRPRVIAAAVASMIREYRADGLTYAEVAARLDADGCRPPGGGAWRPSTLHRVLERAA